MLVRYKTIQRSPSLGQQQQEKYVWIFEVGMEKTFSGERRGNSAQESVMGVGTTPRTVHGVVRPTGYHMQVRGRSQTRDEAAEGHRKQDVVLQVMPQEARASTQRMSCLLSTSYTWTLPTVRGSVTLSCAPLPPLTHHPPIPHPSLTHPPHPASFTHVQSSQTISTTTGAANKKVQQRSRTSPHMAVSRTDASMPRMCGSTGNRQ